MPDAFGRLTYGELVAAVGASPYMVQQAIAALGIRGEQDMRDLRIVWYPASAVFAIQNWIRQNKMRQ